MPGATGRPLHGMCDSPKIKRPQKRDIAAMAAYLSFNQRINRDMIQTMRHGSQTKKTRTKKAIVFGNSIYAEYIYYLLTHDSPYDVGAFTVDAEYITRRTIFDLPVVAFESIETVLPPDEYKMILSISFQRMNRLRQEKYVQAKAKGYELINYISSSAKYYPDLAVGDNCAIMENVVVGPFAKIGNNVVIASGSIVGHHAVIEDHAFISNGVVVLGRATIGEYSLVGANATIKEGVRVARQCIIGSGVSITKHTQEKGVYVNPPVKLYPKRSDQMQTWMMWPQWQSLDTTGRSEKPAREMEDCDDT